MSKGLFEDFEEEKETDFFEEAFQFTPKKKKKVKKTKPSKEIKKEEQFGTPVESLFDLPPVTPRTEEPIFGESEESEERKVKLKKNVPPEIYDCIMDCLCEKQIETPKKSIPKVSPKAEKRVMEMFEPKESEDEDLSFIETEDDEEDHEIDDDDEEVSVICEEDSDEDEEEDENEGFFGQFEKKDKPFNRGGFKF